MSLVPYSNLSRQILRSGLRYGSYAARTSPYARGAKFVYDNRHSIAKAAKVIGKGVRKIKSKRKPANLKPYPSDSRGAFAISHVPGTSAFTPLGSKQLYADRLSMPAIGTGDTTRLTNQIFLKNISICLKLQAIKTFNKPVEIHFALCQLGSDDTTTTNWEAQFFRGDSASDNVIDFQQYATNKNWDIRYLCNSLNPDNKNVLLHKKFMIDIYNSSTTASWPNGNGQGMSKSLLTRDFFIPIKRVIKFSNSATDLNERPFVVFMWGLTSRPDDHDAVNQQSIVLFNYRTRLSYSNVVN